MASIFSNLPNDLIMKIIREVKTPQRLHAEAFASTLSQLNFAPSDIDEIKFEGEYYELPPHLQSDYINADEDPDDSIVLQYLEFDINFVLVPIRLYDDNGRIIPREANLSLRTHWPTSRVRAGFRF